jgi:DNA-binding beta-propeller fold protein YncE
VSPDGKNVYVANNDSPTSSYGVSQYDVGAGGALSPKNPATVTLGVSPSAVVVSPDGRSVYVTASAGPSGFQSYVLQYDVGANGTLSPKTPARVPGPFGPLKCRREGTSLYCTGALFSGGGMAVSPDGHSVYVAGYLTEPFGLERPGEVLQYDVGAGGALSPKNPLVVQAGNGGDAVAVSPGGRSVYVANRFTGPPGPGVSQYDVGAGGALSPKSPATVVAGSGPSAVAVSPDGRSVYVTDSSAPFRIGDASQYDVGAGGALSPKIPPTVATENFPQALAVSPGGQSVYVPNSASHSLSQYDVGAGGALSPKSLPTVESGSSPLGIAVTPLARVPTRNEQCKRGGWRDFSQFRNQGRCVSFVQTHR